MHHQREHVNIVFIHMKELGGGRPWKSIQKNSDFFDEAKAFITTVWKFDDDPKDIHLSCYVDGCDGRNEFTTSAGYWNMTPTTQAVYFWVGRREDSPSRQNDDLLQTVHSLRRDVKRLKAVSATVKHQLEVWNAKLELSLDAFDQHFPPVDVRDEDFFSVEGRLLAGPTGKYESHVQEMWNGLMQTLAPDRWKDCRKPEGIQFDGRRHDIDIVLLRENMISILYLDASIELKDTLLTEAKRREVVMQLLDRFGATFDGQRKRQVCWGIGMDAYRAVFVKCHRNMDYAVTAPLDLRKRPHLRRLFAFTSPAANRGFIVEVLPTLFSTYVASRLGNKVYLLQNGVVCKLGQRDAMEREHAFLCQLNDIPFLTLGVREDELFTTGCTDEGFQFGFRMAKYNAVGVMSEDELTRLAGNIFWRLGVLHHLGFVHRDIKPSNILAANGETDFLLSDYGAATKWQAGRNMTETLTEEFSSVSNEFEGTGRSMFLRDLESLFWTVFLLWLQIVKKRDSPGRFASARRTMISVLGVRGGALVGEEEDLIQPSCSVLSEYLVGQASKKTLLVPSTLFRDTYIKGMAHKDFNATLAAKNLLACPEAIFVWLRDRL